MKNIFKVVLPVYVLMVFLSVQPVCADEKLENKAIAVSRTWLGLVDNGQYGKSWDAAATLFQNAISKGQWKQSLAAVRTPLGRVVERRLQSKQYATSLPGAPDGQYVVIQYKTSFENKKHAIETITPMRDADGTWRVSGYYIK